MTNSIKSFALALLLGGFLLTSCGGGGGGGNEGDIITQDEAGQSTTKVNEAGADTSISAIDGGAGFAAIADSLGWDTNTEYKSVANKNAPKGGSVTMSVNEYPSTFRYYGKNSNYSVSRRLNELAYESLLGYDSENNKSLPSLATHWKISEDKKTYTFRIDPNARWSDGLPVTADDVIATYDLLVNKDIEDSYYNLIWKEDYERPEKISKYIVSVKAKSDKWSTFLSFSGTILYPAYHLEKITGKDYLDTYQYKMLPGTGPYILDNDETKEGTIVSLKRRDDYWAKDYENNKGLYNFDHINFLIVREPRLELEKFMAGEFDFYIPSRAQWWIEEISDEKSEAVKNGLIQKRKIFNYRLKGLAGFALNTQVAPFDDIKVREAMSYLFNFDELNKKIFYDQYERLHSYYPGSIYACKNNVKPEYNPAKAKELLQAAGWAKKSGEKWLSKDDKIFELDFMSDKSLERIFIPYQQDLESAGIKFNFVTVDGNKRFKQFQAKDFTIGFMTWGSGGVFPSPESFLHSKYGTTKENTNITGMANERIDELIEKYNVTYDGKVRAKFVQEIDSIATAQKHYVMGWGAPYTLRVSYWNNFGMPESGLSYTGDFADALAYWWYEEDNAKKVKAWEKDKSIQFEKGQEIVDFWNLK